MGLLLRDYKPSDLAQIKALHAAQGLEYVLPDVNTSEFILKAVMENGNGVDMGFFLRRTAEAYLVCSSLSRREGIVQLLILDKEITPIARKLGLTDVYCMVPPDL